jgi:hypothetical protein
MQTGNYGDETFTRSPNVIRQSKRLSASAKLVYQSLLYFAGDKLECFPKEETIAHDTGLTAKTVRGAIGELVAHKLISQERMEHLRGKPKGYRLHVIPAEFTGDQAVRLPAMRAETATEDRKEERPAQPANQPKPARESNQLEHEAFRVFQEVTGWSVSKKVEGLRDAIATTVTDLDRWRRVLQHCVNKGLATNTLRIVDAYNEEWGGKVAKPQDSAQARTGGTRPTLNSDWERRLRKGQGVTQPKEEGISSGTAAQKQNPAISSSGVLSANQSQ